MKKLIIILLMAALALGFFGCTTKKERVPGPLVVWVSAEEDEQMELRLLADDFIAETKVPLELVFKTRYELQFTLLRHPEDLKGVDLVEVDFFDVPEVSEHMADMEQALQELDSTRGLFVEAFDAGRADGVQKFIPWRLSWPAMVSPPDYSHQSSFASLASRVQGDQMTIVLPGLDDRDLYAMLCAVVWSAKADPAEPGPAMAGAMKILEALAQVVRSSSAATVPGGAEEMDNRADIIFDWPVGLIALGSEIPLDLVSSSLPCNNSNCVPFFGRYLASPKTATHPEDAVKFVKFMISTHTQSRLASSSTWLPVRSDSLADLGARDRPYDGIRGGSAMLRAMPRDENVRRALVAAGRKVLFENATAEQGLDEFNEQMK